MIDFAEIDADKDVVCRRLLASLPEWFGIPEAIDAYAAAVRSLPMLGARADGAVIGFLALKFHTEAAAEAYVVAVDRAWHRQGVGTGLFRAAEAMASARGCRFLTVKTVAGAGDPADPHYGATRRFYQALGFLPIEVFPTLWDRHNPCLMLLKPIAG